MLGFKVNHAVNLFFDKPYVASRVSAARRKGLSKIGAFVRRTARALIRKSKKPSAPGSPPRSHEGSLRRFLFFAYDPNRDSVVIGPAKTNQTFFDGDGRPVTGTVPEVLEFGGRITVEEVLRPAIKLSGGLELPERWQRRDQRFRRQGTQADLPRRRRTVEIAPRPFMGPAQAENQPKFADLWSDSIVP